MQIRSEVSRKVANKQTDKQTDKQRRKHNHLGEGNYGPNDSCCRLDALSGFGDRFVDMLREIYVQTKRFMAINNICVICEPPLFVYHFVSLHLSKKLHI